MKKITEQDCQIICEEMYKEIEKIGDRLEKTFQEEIEKIGDRLEKTFQEEIEKTGDRLIIDTKNIESHLDKCQNELIATMRYENGKANTHLGNIKSGIDYILKQSNREFDLYFGGVDSNGEFIKIPPQIYK